MSITSGRLLANCCCIYMLLLSVVSTIAQPTRATTSPTSIDKDSLEHKTVHHSSPNKDKCQYNLLDSSRSLEANSSIYQHQGFSQCEFIIKAPSGRFILLNFTQIHSKSDMPVEIGARLQHLQQAATQTTTTATVNSPSAPAQSQLFQPLHRARANEKASAGTLWLKEVADLTSSTPGKQEAHSSSNLTHTITSIRKNSSIEESGGSGSAGGKDSSSQSTLVTETPTAKQHRPAVAQKISVSGDSGASSHNSHSKHGQERERGEDSQRSQLTRRISPQYIDNWSELQDSNYSCHFQLFIEAVNSTSGSLPHVICGTSSWQDRAPLVYQYSVPIKITFKWNISAQSSFSLNYSFLRPEEVDCLFRCNRHLCLPKKYLLCDGYVDCPDQSDEQRNACTLATQQQANDEPSVMKVVIIIISVIFALAFIIAVILMISRIRCRNGARQGRDSLLQPPHSQSSEVCHSASGSIQDNGQCEALLHERQHPDAQRQTSRGAAVSVVHANELEHHQLLHPSQPSKQGERCHRQVNPRCLPGQQHHQRSHEHQPSPPVYGTENAKGVERTCITRAMQRQHQKQPQQQQHHKHARTRANPDEEFPPHICVSGDGEEGYTMAQKALHSKQQAEKNWQAENDMVRPPPNRTIFDRDSPPPPYSAKPPGTKSLDSLVPSVGVASMLRPARSSVTPQGSPTGVSQSHSLSCHH